MVNKCEALIDALGRLNGIHDPSSECYQLRNPLLIRSFARAGKHAIDSEGRRVFPSLLSGLKASEFDMLLKLKGQSRAGLKPTDTLTNLFGVYGFHEKGAIDTLVAFLRRALKDQNISARTELSYFLESK